MFTHILSRGDTSANLTANNPILLEKEICIETDTNKIKIGDGVTAYNSLAYFGSTGGGANQFAIFQERAPIWVKGTQLTGTETKRLVTTEVYNDITGCSLNIPNTSITLPAGTYRIEAYGVTNPQGTHSGFNAIWRTTDDFNMDAPLVQGTNSFNDYNMSPNQHIANLSGVVVLLAETEIALYYKVTQMGAMFPADGVCGDTRGNGPGDNLYASIYIEKIA